MRKSVPVKPVDPSRAEDALKRQLDEATRREHDKHLNQFRKQDPNSPYMG